MLPLALLALGAPCPPAPAGAQAPPAPQTILLHGNILTGAHLLAGDHSPTPARVQAVAIAGGRVVAVGDDAAVDRLRGPGTTVIDLHGAFAMPGFNDAHTHMAMAGQQKLSVNLAGTRSLAEMQERIRAFAQKMKPGEWILGGGWDQTLWKTKTLPSREDIDALSFGHPALLDRVDGHIALLNTAALEAAHINPGTAAPAGGSIDRRPSGELTGIVREDPALALVRAVVPPPGATMRQQALRLSIDEALRNGVTSVQDFSDWEDWRVLEAWERSGQLPLRFAEWIPFDLPLPRLRAARASHPADDPLLHLAQLKGFMDGSLGSHTAALNDPYHDEAGNAGLPRYTQTRLDEMAAERVAAGFQLGFHAIGDRANDMALNAFAAAERGGTCPAAKLSLGQACSPRDFRLRIEHAQVVSAAAFDRFRQLGVIASVQPSHLLTDMAWAGDRLGPRRAKLAYTWRSFLDHGVTVAFGTDYPVESISPFRGLYAAVTRKNEAGTQTFEPQERLTIQEAIYAYTQASAFAEFREHSKGRLEPGFLADLVVLDRDITQGSPEDLLKTRVLRTVVGGQTRYLGTKDTTASARQP